MLKKEFSYYPNSSKHNMMLLLLRDFCSRYWLAVIYVMIIAFISNMFSILEATGSHFFVKMYLFPVGSYLLFWEQRQGVRKVTRTLPISRNLLTKHLWLEAVFIFPILFLAWCFILALPVNLLMSSSSLTLQYMLINAVLLSIMAMGFSGTLVYAQNHDFSDIFQNRNKLLWTLTGIPFFILLVLYPVSRVNMLRHIPVFIVCATTLVISYKLRNRLLPETVVIETKNKDVPPSYYRSRFSFYLNFWALQTLVLLICLFLLTLFYITKALLLKKTNIFEDDILVYYIILGCVIPAGSAEWVNEIKLLRTLPMSSKHLLLTLLSVPIFRIIPSVMFILLLCLALGTYDKIPYILLLTTYSLGASIILCNVAARFGRLGYAFFLIASIQFGIHTLKEALLPISIIGFLSIPLLMYQIKNSATIYRHRASWILNNTIPRRP